MRSVTIALLAIGLLLGNTAAGQTGNGTPAPPELGADGKPLGVPYKKETTDAYKFRERLSSDPQCQALGQEADKVMLEAGKSAKKQQDELNAISVRAKAQGCI